jgi:O-antigen/teichoic acid export membrane protein
MRQKFAINLAFLFGANLLVKPFWIFGIDRVVQNTLGAAEYGFYFAVFNFSLLFSVLLDVGLSQFNSRAVSRVPERLPSYFGNLMLMKFILAAVYFSVTVFLAIVNGFDGQKMKLLLWLLVNQTLLTFILFFRSNLQALQLFKIDSFVSVSDRLLSIIFCGSMIWFNIAALSIWNFVWAQTAALFLTALISGTVVMWKARGRFYWWKPSFRLKILRSTLPYALLVFLMTIYARVDAVLIDRLLGELGVMQAGIYAASFRIFDAANQFGFLFSTILLPMFSSNFKQQVSNNTLVHFSLQSILAMAVPVAALCVFWSPFWMQWLYHRQDSDWNAVFTVTMLCFIPASATYILGTLLTAKGELIALCKMAAVAVVINVVANFCLIPRWGALGSAFAALTTHLLVLVLHVYAVSVRVQLRWSAKELTRIVLFFLSCFAATRLISFLPLPSPYSLSLGGSVLLMLIFGFKMIPLSDVFQMWKKRLPT